VNTPVEQRQVYFALRASDGAIKIGCSVRPEQRLVALRREAGCGVVLLATINAPIEAERHLHRYFGPEWLEREWFSPSCRLLLFVEAVKAGDTELPQGPTRPSPFRSMVSTRGQHNRRPRRANWAPVEPDPRVVSHSQIVARAGVPAIVRSGGISRFTAQSWRKRNSIPARHWALFIRLGATTVEELASAVIAKDAAAA
jgi:hypothetical protein